MPLFPRSLDDLILDGLVAKIASHRDDDVLSDPALAFDVSRDRTTPWQDLVSPLVNCEMESDTPDRADYVARYRIACMVPSLDDDDAATARLFVLKEQVRRALLDREGRDLGQATGTIGSIKRPSWNRISFDDSELDTTILAGSWSIEICYSYEAADIDGPALSEISIDTGRFSALYPIGGQP